AIGVFQIVNQLRQILDGINVVVRRRRNETDARRGKPGLGDPWIYLASRQFAAFTRLGALRHFDLKLLRVDKVMAGDAEPAGSDLFDGAVLRIAVGQRNVAVRVLAAFAGVAFAADAVHGDGERLVRFLADGAIAHRAGLETFHDFLNRLDFLDGQRLLRRFEFEQAAQGAEVRRLIVDQFGVFPVNFLAAQPAGNLQLVNRLRVEQVIFAAVAPLILAARVERDAVHLAIRERMAMPLQNLLGQHIQPHAFNARRCPGEILVDDFAVETDGLENLRAAITLNGRDAHFGHRLDHAFHGGLDVFLDGGLVVEIDQQALANHVVERLKRHVGIDGAATVADEQREVVYLARFAGFEDEAGLAARALPDQMMVQARHGQQ